MNTITVIAILAPTCLAVASLVFNYIKERRSTKDRLWETAERITIAQMLKDDNGFMDEHIADEVILFFYRAHQLLKRIDDGTISQSKEARDRLSKAIASGSLLPEGQSQLAKVLAAVESVNEEPE